ncbi:glycosyltransferase [uncultured Algibacter sp.]|uniref:glycosyltransferase family 2 protein n=1 Tax=uncultured Algibacter sp. TaxID=298659 RepID=UPI00261022B8|nr:glycosyltransferase [uncultured Algibacter sp.]
MFHLNNIPSKTRFSVVVPFRNESENLPSLLQSIQELNYSKHLYEVILIDDASEDHSIETIKPFLENSNNSIQIIPNVRRTESPKKDAITLAVARAKNEWIITTDADCVLPEYWLDSFDEYIQQSNALCIAAPVSYNSKNSFLNRFQILDILSLQGATIGGFGINKPFMCNGANFAYQKTLFNELHGFHGNAKIASGDDIFLLEKIVKAYGKQVHYLKCSHAIVTTSSEPTWNTLISQRIRWASKTKAYNWFGKTVGSIVLFINLFLVLVLPFIYVINLKIFIYILILKFKIDFFLIYKSAIFFNKREALKTYPLAFLLYPFFTTYVALTSLFYGYTWKNRQFK